MGSSGKEMVRPSDEFRCASIAGRLSDGIIVLVAIGFKENLPSLQIIGLYLTDSMQLQRYFCIYKILLP